MLQEAPHTGEVQIEVGGEQITLRFDWAAISRLRGEFGEGFEQQIEDAFSSLDVDNIAKVLSAGSDKPPRWWMQQSPPIVTVAFAARKAITHAFLGGGFDETANPLQPGMLTSLLQLVTRISSGARSKGGSAPAGAPKNSGG
jgi:hypothetical protein